MKLIDVSTRKHQNTFTIVDDEDFDFLNQWKWGAIQFQKMTYVMRTRGREEKWDSGGILMHRFLMHPPKNMMIDHINRNSLDNRKENLRACTSAQNQINAPKKVFGTSSKYKGVHFHKDSNAYRAATRINGRCTIIGTFATEEEAALAYNKKVFELHGEFAYLNVIPVSGDKNEKGGE